ncbi:MAG: Holliday junction resolvase RuvX [Raineya sp.]|jgi:putative Holliday junction resolvase|nr:Holliday junction resolvase RuvX [Raineya sp.]
MPRIIAIDYGSKRVGLAVTDNLKIIATALETVHSKDILDFLEKYMQKEEVEAFVVGMPKNLDGEDTNNTPLVENFVKALKKKFTNVPVHLLDERFTSKIALDSMIMSGSKKKDRNNKSGNIDKVSAVIILQDYLNSIS